MPKKRMKAELWDKTQFILSDFYDRMMHYALFFEGALDIAVLRKAIYGVIGKVPALHSSYVPNIIRPYWRINANYGEEEMAEFEEVDDLEPAVFDFFKGKISYKENLQFRFKFFVSGNCCALALLVNHQCFDGSDMKYVMLKIAESYNAILKTGSAEQVTIKEGTRSLKQLYVNMDSESAKEAKKLYRNVSRTGSKPAFHFADDEEGETRFVLKRMEPELFLGIKKKGKESGATVNDLLLAAFLRALAKNNNCSPSEPISVTSMIDLRRHMKNGDTEGVTNMTGFMPTLLQNGIGESFEETLSKVVEANAAMKKDGFAGLSGIPLLGLAYKIFWVDCLATLAIKIGYRNPLLQMSNIGILRDENAPFEGCKLVDCFITGAVKYKPYFQLTCLTHDNHLRFCVAERCSKADEALIEAFLDDLLEELKEYARR